MTHVPTRLDVRVKLWDLATGRTTREADEWATAALRVIDELGAGWEHDDVVWNGLLHLHGCDLQTSPTTYLHGRDDFEAWLSEFDSGFQRLSRSEELRRLAGDTSGSWPEGAIVLPIQVEASDLGVVVDRVREVVRIVAGHVGPLDEPTGRRLLPAWFLDRCGAGEGAWALPGWLDWMEPDDRTWYWWSEHDHGFEVVVWEWPTALGSLEWLVTAAGASAFDTP